MNLRVFVFFCLLAFFEFFVGYSQSCVPQETPHSWAETTLNSFSLEQKVGQLMMIRVHSDWSSKELNSAYSQIQKHFVGGVCFFSGTPLKQVEITNHIQSLLDVPLLISIDGEWGPSMRLDNCAVFPHQMTLGALPDYDDHLIFEFGREVGRQCKALGIHINFAPCVDVNNNSKNPVINSRSFGESREQVARKGKSYMLGMQSVGLTACAKHFPGHGDTHVDSHKALPMISKSRTELDSLELFPFRDLIHSGVEMVMVSHLNVPALNDTSFSIATLSKKVITDLLKNELGFDGLVVTDGMDMKGLRNSYPTPGEAELMALMAGTDILLLPGDLDKVVSYIIEAVDSGKISEDLINEKCLRILELKYKKGLNNFKNLSTGGLSEKLNTKNAANLIYNMQQDALTLLRNRSNLLPVGVDTSTMLLCIGALADSSYLQALAHKYHWGFLQVPRDIAKSDYEAALARLVPYEKIVVAVLQTSQYLKNKYGILDETTQFLNEVVKDRRVALALLGNPYGLERLGDLEAYDAIAIGYQYNESTTTAMLAAIAGDLDFTGHLPVSTAGFPAQTALHYYSPENSVVNTSFTILTPQANHEIDSLVYRAIHDKIIPGCQILALKNNKVVFAKNFGYLTYEDSLMVNDETMYDVASMTKSLATTLAMMKLYDENKYELSDKIGDYLTYLKGTDKAKITIAELLTHTSGLPAFIPFYREIAVNGKWDARYLQKNKSEKFPHQVAENIYLCEDFPSIVQKRIAQCKLGDKKYVYSDLNFILLKDMVEELSGMPLDEYLMQNFYLPMNLKRTRFNPLKYVSKDNIAPTELDNYFRNQQIQGYVHDQSAAVLDGVGGNAGLFSTAHEVADILSMLMHNGMWKGQRYLSEKTVRQFVATHPMHSCSRRALGFDTPSYAKKNPVLPEMAKKHTFGHQGFTGTVFWCDPDNDLVYIFLSNRVYPNAEPNNLSKSRLRLLVHEVIYKDLAE